MGFTPYQFFLVTLMLVTGSINTISTKWADKQEARFCDRSGNATTFEHPFLQAVGMFIGEIFCLIVFKLVWFSTARYRASKMTYPGDASSCIVQHWPIRINRDVGLVEGEQNFNPLVFWVASILDMLSTCLAYFALNLTTASTFQMLRGSVIVFTAIFSLIFLKKKLRLIQWLGILIVIAGLIVVGVSGLIYPSGPEDQHSTGAKLAGILLILLGMVFTGLQMVYEERFVGKFNVPPLQAVGWEGIFGFFTLGFLLIPFSFIRMAHSNSGPNNYLEDVPSAFCQMGDNHIIIVALVGNIFSIAFFNFAGISVTKELSSTTRMVLDNGRTIVIWAVTLALKWQDFHGLQVLGFILLVIGMGTYNGVWEHLYRRYIKGEKGSGERKELIPSYDELNQDRNNKDHNTLDRDSFNQGRTNIAPDKDSLN